jgi:hypothetical protein
VTIFGIIRSQEAQGNEGECIKIKKYDYLLS